jgi:hypothetical protein
MPLAEKMAIQSKITTPSQTTELVKMFDERILHTVYKADYFPTA